MRANDLLVNTDVPFTKWLEHDVEPRMNSYMAWMQEEASANLTWRAGRPPSEIRWLSLVEDILFGTRWDAAVKVLTKAGTMPADALSQGVSAEELSQIASQHRAEQTAAEQAQTARESGHATKSDPVDDTVDLTVHSIQLNGAPSTVGIRLDALSDDAREIAQSALQRARKNLAANVVLLNKDSPIGLNSLLARTSLGQLRGAVDLIKPARSKFVGIFFDVKCTGEATHRPHLRIPPLQRGDATLNLLEAARARCAQPRLATGLDAPEGSLDAGDIYFLLDGGMTGNVGTLLKQFQTKDKVSKTFTVLKDLASVDKRHERVRGVGNVKQTETLLVVSQNQINLPPVKYQQFTGGTNGDVIGPVVLAPPETQWQATWAEKRDLRAGAAHRGGRQVGSGRARRIQAQEAPHRRYRGASVLS